MIKNTDVEIANNLNKLIHTMRQLKQLRLSHLALIDPSSGQGKVLSILKVKNPISQKELVRLMDMQPQSSSELLKKLEKKKLIHREKSTDDKRTQIIFLTSGGQKAVKKLGMSESDIIGTLTEDQKYQFSEILEVLNKKLESQYKIASENFGTSIFGKK